MELRDGVWAHGESVRLGHLMMSRATDQRSAISLFEEGNMDARLWKPLLRLVQISLAAALNLFAMVAWAADFPPKTYSSPSGNYSLAIDPSDREGAGKARYVLKHGGEIAWSGDEPFTFWDAFVADDGTFGGYAYTEGYSRDAGEFIVALLDPKGNVRMSEKAPRKFSPYLHTAGDPKASGIFAQPEADRFVVRVRDPDLNADQESWWTYQLSDGHLLGKPKPHDTLDDGAGSQYIVAARPIANTPLTLIHWVKLDGSRWSSGTHAGALFTLVDTKNKPVWKLDLPGDYTNRDDERAEARLLSDIYEHGGILENTQPAHFTIQHTAANVRVTYVATPSSAQGGKWDVKETSRAALSGSSEIKAEASSKSTPSDISLKKLGSIDLTKKSPGEDASPIHDVWNFAPGEAGRFGVLRNCGCDSEGKHSLVIVNDSGKLVREVPLPPAKGEAHPNDHLAWLKGDAWVVTTSFSGNRSDHSTAARVDAATGMVTPLTAFTASSIDALAGQSDGGFVALTRDYETSTLEQTVTAFDEHGSKRWDIHEGNGEGELFSPEGVAVATSGEVVVLENIRNQLKIFTPDGQYRATIDLKDTWGRKPNYVSGIHADSSGGVLIHDFQGSPSIVHMSLSGDVLGTFTPAYKDARHFDITGDVQASPTGDLWTSDGHALLHLDKRGVVDRVLGEKPNFDSLGNIAAVVVTPKGWIYAADERTGAVHVLNENGELQHVCHPNVSDYKGHLSLPSLTVADSGDVFITHSGVGEIDARPDFLHYDAQGKRVGIEKVDLDEVAQAWLSQRGTTNRWVLGYTRAYLADSNAKVLRRVERTADGQWVETPGPGSVAPDGSIALVSGAHGDPMSRTSPKVLVSIFSADGNPVVTWPAPNDISTSGAGIAFDGEHLAFVQLPAGQEKPTGILVTDKAGSVLFKAPLQSAQFDAGVYFVRGREGSQLWVYDGKSSIDRYAAPW
jgi:hypothetical protein